MSLYRHRRSCVKLELLLQLSSSSSPLAHTRCCCCVSAPAHSLRSCRSCRLAAHSRAVAVAADRPQVTTLALLLLLFSCHRAYRRIVPPYRAALFSASRLWRHQSRGEQRGERMASKIDATTITPHTSDVAVRHNMLQVLTIQQVRRARAGTLVLCLWGCTSVVVGAKQSTLCVRLTHCLVVINPLVDGLFGAALVFNPLSGCSEPTSCGFKRQCINV